MATATVTIHNLTQTQRAAIRRTVARRNDRMWDNETTVSLERGKLIVNVAWDTVTDDQERDVRSRVIRASHEEARSLMIAIGRTFDYDVEVAR